MNRGVVYWSDSVERRILFAAGRRLYSLDATTGRPAASFGDSGWVDLANGLGRDIGDAYIVATSPGVTYQDLLIQGTRVGEGEGSAPGDIRAYDVRTGKNYFPQNVYPKDYPELQKQLTPLKTYPVEMRGDEIWVDVT